MLGHHAKSFFKNKQFRNRLTENWAFRVWVSLNVLFDSTSWQRWTHRTTLPTAGLLQHQETSTSPGGNIALPGALWSTLSGYPGIYKCTCYINTQFPVSGCLIIPNIRRWSWWSYVVIWCSPNSLFTIYRHCENTVDDLGPGVRSLPETSMLSLLLLVTLIPSNHHPHVFWSLLLQIPKN